MHSLGQIRRERERFTAKYPHFFVWTLQPRWADYNWRPRGVFLFLASVQFLCLASPRKNICSSVKGKEAEEE